MLKYCLINSGFHPNPHLNAGVEQWPAAVGGDLVEPEALGTPAACSGYDIIHIVCAPQNFRLIAQIRIHLGRDSKTKLVLSFPSVFAGRPQARDHGALTEVCQVADLLFGSDYATVQYYEGIVRQPAYVLTHPADISQRCSLARPVEKVAFVMKQERFDEFNQQFMQLPPPEGQPCLQGRAVEVISDEFSNDPAFLARLAQFAFICFDSDLQGHDDALIYLASRGCALIGGGRAEVNKRCFALSAHLAFEPTLKTLHWLLADVDAKNYMLEYAADKLEYYNHGNSRDRLLKLLASTGLTGAREALNNRSPASRAAGQVNYLDSIHHVSGPVDLSYGANEFAVTCLVKDGAEYLPSFLRHYRNLGAKHFYFIDNESSDDTRDILADQPDVTLYRTALVFKKFESEIRRVIIEKHCTSKWCFSVDIDELFEYPGLGTISSASFIDYLNANKYTAVVAYMLDMFAVQERPHSIYLEDLYTNFSLRDIEKEDYFAGFEAFCNYNVLPCPEIGNYYGGVRQSHVKASESRFLLTKHALMFIDNHLEAVTMSHFCNNARVADVTCLLKHYKLTASLKQRIEDGIKTEMFSFILKDQIAAYLALVGNGADPTSGRTSEVFAGVSHFVDNGFLHVSDNFRNHLAGTQ